LSAHLAADYFYFLAADPLTADRRNAGRPLALRAAAIGADVGRVSVNEPISDSYPVQLLVE
jgi:hypothetical protein